jgi:hypothetical protein
MIGRVCGPAERFMQLRPSQPLDTWRVTPALLQNLLGTVTFLHWGVAKLASGDMRRVEQAAMMDLQAKAEKYERKAARYEESAQRAAAGPQRALYEELARYYGGLATDFRHVLAKQMAA